MKVGWKRNYYLLFEERNKFHFHEPRAFKDLTGHPHDEVAFKFTAVWGGGTTTSFGNFSNKENVGSRIFPALDLFCFFFGAMPKKKNPTSLKPSKKSPHSPTAVCVFRIARWVCQED